MIARRLDIEWKPDLPVFASEPYLRTLSSDVGWIGGLAADGEVRCILPYVILRKASLALVRFTVEPIATGNVLSVDEERRFLDAVVNHFRREGTDVIVPPTFSCMFRTAPTGATTVPYGNLVADLTIGEDAMWSRVHGKHRNAIRNAQKQGVTIRTGSDLTPVVFELTRASLLRSAGGLLARAKILSRTSRRHFSDLVEALGSHVEVLVAEHDGVPQAGAVIPYSEHAGYYLYGGTADRPIGGSSNLLQWEAMRRLGAQGVRSYNFFGVRASPEPGSKAEGLLKFKQRFGGSHVSCVMWKIDLSPRRSRLYAFAAALRSGGDVVDQERARASRRAKEPSAQHP